MKDVSKQAWIRRGLRGIPNSFDGTESSERLFSKLSPHDPNILLDNHGYHEVEAPQRSNEAAITKEQLVMIESNNSETKLRS